MFLQYFQCTGEQPIVNSWQFGSEMDVATQQIAGLS